MRQLNIEKHEKDKKRFLFLISASGRKIIDKIHKISRAEGEPEKKKETPLVFDFLETS